MKKRRVVALIAAAGSGTRLGGPVPKAFVEINGRTLLERAVETMDTSGVVDKIVVVISPDMEAQSRQLLAGREVCFVHGGAERADSIWEGLKSISDEDGNTVVLVHDAARALTPPEMVVRITDAVANGACGVVPVLPVADTIKRVESDRVTATPDRAQLRAVQTPQGFQLGVLRAATEAYFDGPSAFTATDDASLLEHFGAEVITVEGDALAFKITTPIDLRLAETLTQQVHE